MIAILLQFSRNVSQTRWIIDDERMGEASIEVLPTSANGRYHPYIC
jgi:tRNA U54 and U55 pseudouridine synthase Pus10